MKIKFTILALSGMTLLAALTAVGISRNAAARAVNNAAATASQTYEVNGKVVRVEATAKTVRIEHEEIPGYMPAMTMPFAVKDAAILKGLASGDRVKFQLLVTDDDSWIARIEKIVGASVDPSSIRMNSAEAVRGREVERLQAGERVPDFTLTNQDGRPVRLSGFRGKAVVLTFIYTRCPLPNFCPLMSKNFASLQQRLEKEFPGRFQLLSISIDPAFDRPQILKRYAARYRADEKQWFFATGTAEQIDWVAGMMGLTFEAENGLIAHDLRTALIGPDGKLVHVWKSNAWTPYEVERRVRETLTGERDVVAR